MNSSKLSFLVIAAIVALFFNSPSFAAESCESGCKRGENRCQNKAIKTFEERMSDTRLSKELSNEEYGGRLKTAQKRCGEAMSKCMKSCIVYCDNCDKRYDNCKKKAYSDASWTTKGRQQEQIDKGIKVCKEKRDRCRMCEKK